MAVRFSPTLRNQIVSSTDTDKFSHVSSSLVGVVGVRERATVQLSKEGPRSQKKGFRTLVECPDLSCQKKGRNP